MLDHHFPIASGGVVRKRDLLRQGVTDREIRAGVREGLLDRPRHGWYSTPVADPDVVRAVRGGGVVTCVSALRMHGIWAVRSRMLHVRETEHRDRSAFKRAYQVQVCCATERDARPCPTAVDSIRDALLSALRCRPLWEVVAALDSGINRGLFTASDAKELFAGRGKKAQRALELMDGRRDSGIETRFHLELSIRGVKFDAQARVLGYPVDTLIGDRLVVELDGAEFHSDPEAFERDREKDRRLAAAGYHVIRVTYRQMLHATQEVLADILRMIRRGDHKWRAAHS